MSVLERLDLHVLLVRVHLPITLSSVESSKKGRRPSDWTEGHLFIGKDLSRTKFNKFGRRCGLDALQVEFFLQDFEDVWRDECR